MDKIEDDVNQAVSFYQGDLENETLTSPLKVLGIMINDKAITIDSVIHFFFTESVSRPKITTLWNVSPILLLIM